MHGPTPLSYEIKSRLTPRGCLISYFAFKPFSVASPPSLGHFFFLNPSCPTRLTRPPYATSPPLSSSIVPQMPPLRGRVSLGGRDETRRRQREAVLPSRSEEVWPLSVPALSQLSHGACSPDCTVSHWVVSLCCLTALCMHFSQHSKLPPPSPSGAFRRAPVYQQHRARSIKRAH